jgi:hypothetical protein
MCDACSTPVAPEEGVVTYTGLAYHHWCIDAEVRAELDTYDPRPDEDSLIEAHS